MPQPAAVNPPRIRPATNADGPRVREIIFGVLREYGLPVSPDETDADLFDIEAHYTHLGGRFDVLVDSGGRILGSVALHPESDGEVELRKMYLEASARGCGYGRMLLEHALAEAARMGFRSIRLETAGVLKEAIALYRSYGFEPYETCLCAKRCDQAYRRAL